MARNTRRRRDSKSKSRFRPRPVSGRAISEKISGERKYKVDKTEKIHLPTLFALICIFIFSIFLRTAWTLEPATDDGFQLTGGSDPYYHKRVVDYVVENGEHLQEILC